MQRVERMLQDVRTIHNLMDRLMDAKDLDDIERQAILALVDDVLCYARLKLYEGGSDA